MTRGKKSQSAYHWICLSSMYDTCRTYTLKIKIIVRMWFWTSKGVYWGAIVFFQIRRSWKSWGSQIFFSVKNIGVSTWNKQEIITIFYCNLCSMTTPMQIINASLNGVSLLVYDNTAVPMGCHTIFDYQIRGSQNIAEVRLELMNPLFQSMVTS